MTADDLRARVASLRVHSAGGQRAPHKPLLLLLALARFAEGVDGLRFSQVETPLSNLLTGFGTARTSARPRPQYPFQHFRSDGLWTVADSDGIRSTGSGDWYVTDLRRVDPAGRFPEDVARLLRTTPGLLAEVAQAVLDAHFEPTLHDEILTAVGLDLAPGTSRRRRDPAFREAVLRAYGYQCAVCGFEVRVGPALVGLDAAHLRWHGHGGADSVDNGVALCALHHRLLDRGAFTLEASSSRERVLVVSEDAHGGTGFQRWLLDFHGRALADPIRSGDRVAEPSLAWHRREVFRGPARPQRS